MNHSKQSKTSRREFLGQMSCAAVGSTALYSTLMNLMMTSRASAQSTLPGPNDHRALVCVFLGGGNDSYNMIVPQEEAEFTAYQSSRSELALQSETLLPITDPSSGKAYAFHESLPNIRDLYNSNDLGVVANVGTLVEPMTKEDYEQDRVAVPLGLFSHSDQQMHWQTSISDKRSAIGWSGRAADILQSLNEASDVSMNISLGGMNILQSGNSVVPYAITSRGVRSLDGYNQDWRPFIRTAVDSMLDQEYDSMIRRSFAGMTRRAIDAEAFFTNALEEQGDFAAAFGEDRFSREMEMVAKCIAANSPLGMRRQTFFVEFGGWDHHDELLNNQSEMLAMLDTGLKAFWDALREVNLQNNVTVFTASDFARTLSSNGDGTDHAWGGHQLVMGGQVQGGRFYGAYPDDLSLNGAYDIDRGRFVPTTSVDEYFGDLVKWMGVSNTDLPTILPNLDRFYNIGSSNDPIGLFG
ncbi:MAG: DUF1501 domain-containing protein [Verrucomicrobiota bacterium]